MASSAESLEVRQIYDVVIDDAQRAHARGRQVQGGGRAEPSRAEQQHLRVEQLLLALHADLRHEHVPRVALALFGGERAWHLYLIAAVLPQRDPARHRGDVRVAEILFQRARSPSGAVTRLAVEHDVRVAVRDDTLDAGLQVALGHVPSTWQVARAVLLGLTHVDDRDALVEQLVHLGRIDLLDAALDFAEKLRSGGTHFETPKSGRHLGKLHKV